MKKEKIPVEKRISYGPGQVVYLTHKDEDTDFIRKYESNLLVNHSLFHVIERRPVIVKLRLTGWHVYHAVFFKEDYKELLDWHEKKYQNVIDNDILSPFQEVTG